MNASELYDLKRLRQECDAYSKAYDALVKLMLASETAAPSRIEVAEAENRIGNLRDRLSSLVRSISLERREVVSEHMRAVAHGKRGGKP